MEEKYTSTPLLTLCHLLNIVDAALTLYAISRGVDEANPVMAWAISVHPIFFVLLKIIVFSVAIEFIADKKPKYLSFVGALFTAVIIWHLSFWFLMSP